MEFQDIVGQEFGLLQVISLKTQGSNSTAVWLCQCQCKRTKLVTGAALRHQGTKSCGCLRRQPKRRSRAKRLAARRTRVIADPETTELRARWSRKRAHSKQRGIAFELTYLQWLQVVSQPCVFCGQAPAPRKARQSYQGEPVYCSSVDRISSTLGYILDNVQPTCDQCNIMKAEMTNQEFVSRCHLISRRHQCS